MKRNRNNLNEFQYYGVYNLHKDNTNKTLAKKQNKIAKVIKIKIQQYLKSSEQLLKLIKQSMTNINNLKYANPVLQAKFEDVLKYIKIFNKNFQIMNDWVQRMHTVLDMKEYENYNQLWLQTMRKIIKNTNILIQVFNQFNSELKRLLSNYNTQPSKYFILTKFKKLYRISVDLFVQMIEYKYMIKDLPSIHYKLEDRRK